MTVSVETKTPERGASAHPVRYAIVLLALRGGTWCAVRTFDNAHDDPEEHHEHAYIGDQKQPPTITQCAALRVYRQAMRRGEDEKVTLRVLVEGGEAAR